MDSFGLFIILETDDFFDFFIVTEEQLEKV